MKTEEIVADFIRNGIIHLELMFPACVADNYMSCNDGIEVI